MTIPNFDTAGSGHVVRSILSHLDRERFEPFVCVQRRSDSDSSLRDMGIPVIEQPFTIEPRPRLTLLSRARRAARPFKNLRIDVWHSWHYLDDYTEPLIAHRAGARWLYTKKNRSWGSRAWKLRSYLADAIVADDPAMIDSFFASSLFRSKATVIPHGVDTQLFRPASREVSPANIRLNLPEDAFVIGIVADIRPIKDHQTLLASVAKLPHHVHVVAAGRVDSDYFPQLRKSVERLALTKRVHFLDRVPQEALSDFWAQADLCVVSSQAEGFGVALVEAMACGKACVATRCGGPERIIEDDVSGILVPVGDPSAMAAAIQQLLDDAELRQAMGRNARARVLSNFTAESEASAYTDLYERLTQS